MNLYLQIGETWAQCPWWFIWTLVAFLLGSLLGWLISRSDKVDTTPLINERDRYHKLATKWEKDYQEIKYRLDESLKAQADLRSDLQRCEADKQTFRYRAEQAEANILTGGRPTVDKQVEQRPTDVGDASGTASFYDGLFGAEELQIFEGIGPRVTEVLQQAGYTNWSLLAAAGVGELRQLLAGAGSRYALSDPESWPTQARMANDGDWAELIGYQKSTGRTGSESKFEKMVAKRLGFSSANPNDLKVVDGIGPKIEKMMKDAGITDWQSLATAEPERLTDLLSAAGNRYRLANASTWPAQAALAAAGDWRGLKAYQQELRDL